MDISRNVPGLYVNFCLSSCGVDGCIPGKFELDGIQEKKRSETQIIYPLYKKNHRRRLLKL